MANLLKPKSPAVINVPSNVPAPSEVLQPQQQPISGVAGPAQKAAGQTMSPSFLAAAAIPAPGQSGGGKRLLGD